MLFKLEQLQKSFENTSADGMLIISEVNAYWLTGFRSSFRYVLVNKNNEVIFITDPRYFLAAKEAMKKYNNVSVWCMDANNSLVSLLEKAKAQLKVNTVLIEEEYVTLSDMKIINKVFSNTVPFNARVMRSIKNQEELDKLTASAHLIVQVMDWVKTQLKPGISEKEMAKKICIKILEMGAEGNSFDPIVAAGLNGSSPHHKPSDYKICEGDFVTIDIGCMLNGYASDMTRTFLVGDKPNNPEMERIYNLVLESQLAGVKAAKAGVSGAQVDAVCRDIIDATEYKGLFAHGTGHGVGMEVHEQPNTNKGNVNPLPVNAVVTVEPGIYKENVGGVRIEDTIVITEDGCVILTDYPKELTKCH